MIQASCDMRRLNECACQSEHCAFQPPTLAATLMVPSWKTRLAVCLFGGALTGIAFFGVMASQEGHQKKVDLINQEVNANAYRR